MALKGAALALILVTSSHAADLPLARVKTALAAAASARDAADHYLWEGGPASWDEIKKRVTEAFASARATQAEAEQAMKAGDAKLADALDVPTYMLRRTADALGDLDRKLDQAKSMREELDAAAKQQTSHVVKTQSDSCMGYYLRTIRGGMGGAALSCGQGSDSGLRLAVTPAEALDLFSFVQANARIPFDAVDNGCFARAHAASYLLERKGVYSRKIFVEGDLHMRTPAAKGGEARWWFHVASLVNVDFPGVGPVEMVFDPAVSACPLTVAQWTSQLTSQRCKRVQPREGKDDGQKHNCEYFTAERHSFNITTDLSARATWRPRYFSAIRDEFEKARNNVVNKSGI